jgi:glycine/D-amino acid oxidase-like deaminating enzyme
MTAMRIAAPRGARLGAPGAPRARRRRAAAAAAAATPPSASASASASADLDVDVAIVGAGIVGVAAALELLRAPERVSVALIERGQPGAAGGGAATGAGQGYLWMCHRDPSNAHAWATAAAGAALWREWLRAPADAADDACALAGCEGGDADELERLAGVRRCGSMLLAAGPAEVSALRARGEALRAAGVEARFLGADALYGARAPEPALAGGLAAAGLEVPGDAQLDGRAAVRVLLGRARAEGKRRFVELPREAAEALLAGADGGVDGFLTSAARRVRARRGVIVAAGAWSGGFLARELANPGWADVVRPRRGHLLELPPPAGMPPVQRGLMEAGYAKHYAALSAAVLPAVALAAAGAGAPPAPALDDVTFTATASPSGSLLLGSSREWAGFDAEPAPEVAAAILARCALFLPALAGARPADAAVRVGLRPYAAEGPMVGSVPGAARLFLAAGHEGSGLTLAPATAAVLADAVLGRARPARPDLAAAARAPAPL